jgi:hypothetical protein
MAEDTDRKPSYELHLVMRGCNITKSVQIAEDTGCSSSCGLILVRWAAVTSHTQSQRKSQICRGIHNGSCHTHTTQYKSAEKGFFLCFVSIRKVFCCNIQEFQSYLILVSQTSDHSDAGTQRRTCYDWMFVSLAESLHHSNIAHSHCLGDIWHWTSTIYLWLGN